MLCLPGRTNDLKGKGDKTTEQEQTQKKKKSPHSD